MVVGLPIYYVMNTVSNKVFSLLQVDSGFPNVSFLGSTFNFKFKNYLVRQSHCTHTHPAALTTHRSRVIDSEPRGFESV